MGSTSNRPFSNLQNLAFNGGGTILYGASGSPYEIQSFSVPGLAKSISYPVDAYPAAVATQGDAYLAAGRFRRCEHDRRVRGRLPVNHHVLLPLLLFLLDKGR